MPAIEVGERKVQKLSMHLNKQTQLDCKLLQNIVCACVCPIHELSWSPIHQTVILVPFGTQSEKMKE